MQVGLDLLPNGKGREFPQVVVSLLVVDKGCEFFGVLNSMIFVGRFFV
jgi:hypothetical protein